MRILYNSKDPNFKSPFGTLTEGENCRISIHIPCSCKTVKVKLVFLSDDMSEYCFFGMNKDVVTDDYDIYTTEFSLDSTGLYFYYFRIATENEEFSLYREGYDMTNMEAGELWQLSCVPGDFVQPSDFCGRVMYQIFPDRFHSSGKCDTEGKLAPFYIHPNKHDLPCYLLNEKGKVTNSDFFGGNLRGITEKLDYLKSLSVGVIYLNPIFKAYSNHRYDTADYMKIDELLGTEEDFRLLCSEAHKRDIKIILDGVFSHTGSNSRYFDKEGVFGGGAYHDKNSPYFNWYEFQDYPKEYTSWWGVETLPCVREMDESYLRFIIGDEDSVVAHWLRAGADGFRLDVADELPDEFIAMLRKRLKEIDPDALLLGEVWEDASNKMSYGCRRRYFTDGELDSVMNYPFRRAIIDYICGADDGRVLAETVMTIAENYPRGVFGMLMNMLSTHDTPRILSILSPESYPEDKSQAAGYRMSDSARSIAERRLRLAAFIQFTLPGMPCIYYGDEIGTEGLADPFCRGYFDWDRAEENSLLDFYRSLSKLRTCESALMCGDVSMEYLGGGLTVLTRTANEETCRGYFNTGTPVSVDLCGKCLFSVGAISADGKIQLDTYGAVLIRL
ncbi:MAG: glycoside hydrolase family 13 protein [Ruminococcaceae bacterium]|nr:glycoside hydrolase family 13 protein [Oscillospiraceae bacterium]